MSEPEEPAFEASHEQEGDTVVVRASGELDAFSADQFAEHLTAAEELTTASVLVDLTGLTYLSSAGVATLVLHTQRYADNGRQLRVVADQPAVLRPIALTGADKAIEVVPTLDDAVSTDSG